MLIGYFTERPYRSVPEDEVFKNRSFFGLSNKFFDPVKGSADYRYYIEEYRYAEELGFDLVALNEHHGNPFCLGSVMNVEASVLAYATKRVRIVLIGNPLPVLKHPLRMAEELAEIDLISQGRLVTGWVRGAGSEQFFNNANPAFNRELFNEAHDFIVQAWTKPGPWRYEGEHFHYRHVNPWALPYQKPHPPIWIPGVLSPETVRWCAEHVYPYIGLGTELGPTCDLWDIYADEAVKYGYQAGTENFGYLLPTVVAETDEKAHELARNFIFGGGQNAFALPEYAMPSGYNSKTAIRMLAKQPTGSWLGVSGDNLQRLSRDEARGGEADYSEVKKKLDAGLRRIEGRLQLVAGSPKTVLENVKTILSVLRPGIFIMFNVQGPASDEQRMGNMRMFAQEVMPGLREYGKEIGLLDAFQKAPGSTKLEPGARRTPVNNREVLYNLGLYKRPEERVQA
jgi:alkanesulfonate monooxygenase SsuD/methylene tetrahydromethanopterin reductase-like flavin-dependent oxidoreductase (luciferase family)